MKVLILASNPRKDLGIDREIRDLRAVIETSHNHKNFEVADALAVRVADLQQLLFKHEPQIVHFCGHGSGQQGLVFQDDNEKEQWVRSEALSELFRLFSSSVQCVLLNACYSEIQANAIVNHIDYVIGMKQEIQDNAAIAFSKGFYQALGYNRSIEQAFEFGRNAIQLEISRSSRSRSTTTKSSRKAEIVNAIEQTSIPEHLKPILKVKPYLSSDTKKDFSSANQALPKKIRTEIQLAIDESLRHPHKVLRFVEKENSLPLEENKASPQSEYTSFSLKFKWVWINGIAWAVGGAVTAFWCPFWDVWDSPLARILGGLDLPFFWAVAGAVGGAVGGAVASLMQLALTPISDWWWWFKSNTQSWAGACFSGGVLWSLGVFLPLVGIGIGLGFSLMQESWFRKKIPFSRRRFWGNILSCTFGGLVVFGVMLPFAGAIFKSSWVMLFSLNGAIYGLVSGLGVGVLYGNISSREMEKLLQKQD